MSHRHYELMDYEHKELMDDLNEFLISVKVHLFDIPVSRPNPTSEAIDELQRRLNEVLRRDARPFKRT